MIYSLWLAFPQDATPPTLSISSRFAHWRETKLTTNHCIRFKTSQDGFIVGESAMNAAAPAGLRECEYSQTRSQAVARIAGRTASQQHDVTTSADTKSRGSHVMLLIEKFLSMRLGFCRGMLMYFRTKFSCSWSRTAAGEKTYLI